ncbi:glutamate racemase [Vespertiliibacter pulmonis]|uniref:Glutamate racemase n=1 Tax=Vespertiliibacter pulmonis TaxID=1443036 RepID=A0A3N4VHM3_9PAST|nr:glutamate racemase [Vespertiliibacter pulmonis]QLB20668.1 glutamate racemase [Vespertiliibacter pulmonis]RPE82552.1 glutamate racemase [Vespertiliibacter pulmonis]
MQPTILLYDSGIGGLTIYDAIRESLPNAHYLYCFDNAYFPYSEKSDALLISQAKKIVQKIAEIYPLDMVIVACNTASTVVLPALREQFSFPIVGTVPAIKLAAEISQTKTIGLLATKGTVMRPYVDELIEKYARDCVVEKIGSTDLVEIVEEKQQTGKVDMNRLQRIILPWQNHPTLDTVILGCTHFPLVKNELQQLLPNISFMIDPGNGIAKRVISLLNLTEKKQQEGNESNHILPNYAFYTGVLSNFSARENMMKQWGFEKLIQLELQNIETN